MTHRSWIPKERHPGWGEDTVRVGGASMQLLAWGPGPRGLQATLADEEFTTPEDGAPLGLTGWWRRLVISRPDRYPAWNEMRNFIQNCPYFDHTRDVTMIIPPASAYVNVHPNAFHWWQSLATTDWVALSRTLGERALAAEAVLREIRNEERGIIAGPAWVLARDYLLGVDAQPETKGASGGHTEE